MQRVVLYSRTSLPVPKSPSYISAISSVSRTNIDGGPPVSSRLKASPQIAAALKQLRKDF
jgi:hypothetical protein